MTDVHFNKDTHQYSIDGDKIPSVTQLLPKQKFWCTDDQLENARVEGNENHALVKMYWDNNKETFGSDYLKRFDKWYKAMQPILGDILYYEKNLYSKKGFAGTADMIFQNGIVD